MRWGAVIRDVAIIFGLTFIGGLIVGVVVAAMSLEPEMFLVLIGLSNIIFSSIGFAISGALAKEDRWKHLLAVALVLWPAGLINLAFGINFGQWVISIVVILLTMGIGGAISYLFSKPGSSSAGPTAD